MIFERCLQCYSYQFTFFWCWNVAVVLISNKIDSIIDSCFFSLSVVFFHGIFYSIFVFWFFTVLMMHWTMDFSLSKQNHIQSEWLKRLIIHKSHRAVDHRRIIIGTVNFGFFNYEARNRWDFFIAGVKLSVCFDMSQFQWNHQRFV